MKFTLAKDWGDHKKGDKIEIKDKSVIEAGKKEGLFKVKETKDK